MSNTYHQKLIVSLIKDHLINTKLINGLNTIGLNADDYSLHLGQTIFDLLEFENTKHSDKAFEYYLKLTKKVNKINITKHPKKLDELAGSIHCKLLARQFEK
ncbi:MAG: hypothetical protein ACXVDZ_09945 [Bacteroidia bacterium]